MIKGGVRARYVNWLLTDLALPQEAGLAALSLSPQTIDRKAARDETLPPDEGVRVIGMASLVGRRVRHRFDLGGGMGRRARRPDQHRIRNRLGSL